MALRFIAIDPETDGEQLPRRVRRRGDRGPAVPGLDRHRPRDAGGSRRAQPDRGQRVAGRGSRPGCGRSSWRRLMTQVPPFSELIAATTTSAVHLETRDAYTPDDPQFLEWKAGRPGPGARESRPGTTSSAPTSRGACGSGARGSSPSRSADFIRFEYESTAGLNVAAGEEVRWLPRRRASDLCLPGNDFWVFDGRLVRFGHFSGDGDIVEDELVTDPRGGRDVRGGVRGGLGARHPARRLPALLSWPGSWPSHRRPASSAPGSSSPKGCATSASTRELTARDLSVGGGLARGEDEPDRIGEAGAQRGRHPCLVPGVRRRARGPGPDRVVAGGRLDVRRVAPPQPRRHAARCRSPGGRCRSAPACSRRTARPWSPASCRPPATPRRCCRRSARSAARLTTRRRPSRRG